MVLGLKVSALTSRYRLSEGIQASLPANQWQLEVENWNSISLASLQGTLLEYAIGPGDPAVLENFWVKPSNAGEKHLCQNQVSTKICIFDGLLGDLYCVQKKAGAKAIMRVAAFRVD